jgi:cytochrome c1
MPRRWLATGLAALGVVLLGAGAVTWIQPTTSSAVEVLYSALPDYERGKALFVAKGCIGCHWHDGVGARGDFPGTGIGPDLSEIDKAHTLLPNDPEYLRTWLRDPWVKNPRRVMPDLGLSEEEIESLLAFLVPSRWGAASQVEANR